MKKTLSLMGALLIGAALAVLMSHYVAAIFQPVRWPTRFYFVSMLLIALIFKPKTAVTVFIFMLPLLPDLHTQLEGMLKPKVKYFVSYAALDLVAGLCIGLWIKRVLTNKRIVPLFDRPSWPIGLLLVTLTASTCLAVFRNLASNNVDAVGVVLLWDHLIQFKLVERLNPLMPINDLLTYCFAGLAISLLIPIFNQTPIEKRDGLIFKPVLFSIFVSAIWGVMQSMTGYGLSSETLNHREATLGWGAHGFQPDLHAFASVMLMGTVGVLGFVDKLTGRERTLSYLVVAISWIALVLSKSKASLLFAVISAVIGIVFIIRRKGISWPRILFWFLCGCTLLILLLVLSKNIDWLIDLGMFLFTPNNWTFETFNTAFVHRPELFRAALLMFENYPFFGVGQGNFFRLSTDFDLARSLYLVQYKGDNAHNYFLQTLAEVGVVGVSAFCLALAWPLMKSDKINNTYPTLIAIYAIFLGNLFSHSLIVRPNLFFLSVFIALLYSYTENNKSYKVS
jgi:hypothetical protein